VVTQSPTTSWQAADSFEQATRFAGVHTSMSIRSNAAGSAEGACKAAPATLGRKTFIRELASAKLRADRDARGFVLCLVDIDQLRNVNDAYGQAAGDAVLQSITRQVLMVPKLPQWRQLDCLQARFDGDGFILMLRDCSLRDGERLAEELRKRCAAQVLAGALRITVSVAVAAYRSGESSDALLARIEQTLNLAKQFGGDRVETARTPESRHDRASVTTLTAVAGANRHAR
jgi:diguanylate cyclase (GGDEF)-like protein